MFSCVAVICFVASALASVAYAAAWGEPPEVCDQNGLHYMYKDCDHEQLEGTNGTAAVSYLLPLNCLHCHTHIFVFQFLCFVQVLLLSVLGVVAIVSGYPKLLVYLPCPII